MEDRLQALEARVRLLEQLIGIGAPARTAAPAEPAAPPAQGRPAPWPPPPPPRAPRPPAARRQPLDLEELLGGRVLGWVGGLAVFLAAVFFLVMAVRNGWIDEPTRVVLAFAGSTALLGAGLWLYERKGQTEAALAAVAAAIAALYASDTTATAVYGLVSSTVGLVLAALIGVAATAVAVRWSSVIVAAIGIVGALLAPVLVGAGTSSASLAFMALALCSAVGVVIWRRWSWLSVTAYVVSLPQLLAWANDERDGHVGLTLVVLGAFWALYVVAALGYELREPTTKLRASSALLLFPNAAVTAATGWFVLHDRGNGTGATAWVLVVAVAHAALGLVSLRGRISAEIGALLAAVGGTLAAVGMALALDGPALVAGWTAEAVLVAWVARRTGDWRGYLGSVAFLAAAAVHALVFEARPDGLAYGLHSMPTTVAGLVLVGAGCAGVAQLLPAKNEDEANALRGAGALVALYLASLLVVDVGGARPHDATQTSQLALSAFWAVLGLGSLLAGLGRDWKLLRLAGLSLLALAVGKVFIVDLAALESIWRVASFLALGLLLLAGAFAYQRMRQEGET